MKLEKRAPFGQEQNDESAELLNKLREKLYSHDISIARKAAYNLSWMQEDGLAILKDALFSNLPRNTKKAAAYGLRSMNGRMKKIALEVLKKGLNHHNRTTKAACIKSLLLMVGQMKNPASDRREIREIRNQKRNSESTQRRTNPVR